MEPLFPQDGTAPLWIASQMGHSEVVRVMLLRGADRDAARNVSRQPPPSLQPRLGSDVTPECVIYHSTGLPTSTCSLAGKQSKSN